MGRVGRKRRRVQENTQGASSSSGPVANGQAGVLGEEEPDAAGEEVEMFYEPLCNLPDDAATLTALLREVAAAVAAGPARLADPRRALRLIRHCAPRLSAGQLTERLVGWCQLLSGTLRCRRQLWCRDAVCAAAARLLTAAARLEEARRLLADGPLHQLLTALVDAAHQATPASLDCLQVVMQHFGRGCGTSKTQITDHLLELFDSSRPSVSVAACRCVALLPHTGPSGSAGAAYAAAWASQIRALVHCFHEHLDGLLDGLVEVQTFAVPEETLERPPPPLDVSEPIQRRYRLARRLVALCQTIQVMLSSATQQPVSVPVSALLDLVCRCQAAGAAATPSAMELRAARRSLEDVSAGALRLLQSLITCCGPSLLLRASVVNRLLVAALQPTTVAQTSSAAADAAHCEAARALTAWLRVAGAGSGLQTDAERLVAALTADVRPLQPAKLTLQTNTTTNGMAPAGGKKKRKAAAEWLAPAAADRPAAQCRPRRCQLALETLCHLVTSLGPMLKVAVHKSLHSLTVGLLMEVRRSGPPPAPFERAECRSGLYGLLLALVSSPHPHWPAPLQFATPLFAHGARDPNAAISALCQGGRAVCVRCVQPSFPTLFFPVDLSDYTKPPPTAEEAPDTGCGGTPTKPTDSWSSTQLCPRGTSAESAAVAAADDADDEPAVVNDRSVAASDDATRAAVDMCGGDAGGACVANDAADGARECTVIAGVEVATVPSRRALTAGAPRLSFGTRVTAGVSAQEQKPALGWSPHRQPLVTVTIASSEDSSGSSDDVQQLADDQRSVETLDASDDERAPSLRRLPDDDDDDDEDEVEILETSRPRPDDDDNNDELAPDVAEMLKDFVNEDPEVE